MFENPIVIVYLPQDDYLHLIYIYTGATPGLCPSVSVEGSHSQSNVVAT